MTNNLQFSLVLTAAGSSTRMGGGLKKEYRKLGNGTVLSCAARVFLSVLNLKYLIVTVPSGGKKEAEKAFYADPEMSGLTANTEIIFTEGSSTRQSSIFNALKVLHSKESYSKDINSYVLIHDAARPFVSGKVISDAVNAAEAYGSSVPGIPAVDTQKETSSNGTIERHLLRKNIIAVQTPQVFQFIPLFKCHEKAADDGKEYTDDSEIWDNYPEYTDGRKIFVSKGDIANKKITFPEDLADSSKGKNMTRIGIGTDLHKLVEGRKFFLGGVEIPALKGEEAHSDGDVLLHAITDALLGASGLGDIGTYFPPEEPQWKDASSAELIKKCWTDVKAQRWKLVNLDCVLEFESPKFIPYRKQVISSIAKTLDADERQIFVKAKTNEKLDSVGKGEAIKAYCVCLLEK